MKAITQDRYGSADVLELREIDRPTPRAGDVLIEVQAAGVDPGVWIFMIGRPYGVRAAIGLRRPRVAVRGRAVAGVVVAVGEKVTRFQPGDEVYGTCESGSFAEYATAREGRLARKPAGLSSEQAAAVPISAATALAAIRVGKVRAGQRVLVIGGVGGVGSYAVQIAKAYGATVTAVCGPGKADLARSIGADDVIDYSRAEIDSTGPRYDVIIDTAGNRPLSLLRRALTPTGTVALVGGGHASGGLLGGFGRQMFGAPLVSMFGKQRLRGVVGREVAADLDEVGKLIDAGTVTPVIDRSYPLADAPDAIRYLAEGHPAGKIVVTVSADPAADTPAE